MIVVFGAGGFIGTYLTDQLARDGYEIIASDTSQLGEAYYAQQGIRYERIDITQKEEFRRLPSQGNCLVPVASSFDMTYSPSSW